MIVVSQNNAAVYQECLGEIAISEIELENQTVSRTREPLLFLKIYLFDHRQMRRVKDEYIFIPLS